jgi:hypothetical protein
MAQHAAAAMQTILKRLHMRFHPDYVSISARADKIIHRNGFEKCKCDSASRIAPMATVVIAGEGDKMRTSPVLMP